MPLQIIGSGFGRTGTMSTKMALEQLGFGPCHHMTEVMGDPEQPPFWKAQVAGEAVDWQSAFAKYTAQVDFPCAAVWPELLRAFPDAKVLHTERPEEEWWASYSTTIGKFWQHYRTLPLPPELVNLFSTMEQLLVNGVFGGLQRETCITAYRRNNALVRETVPADKLLIFTPSDGWDPLCRFLSVPAPEGEFPRSNARDEFWALFGGEPEPA
ncbi:sulfotransferase family protein [Amaricoccus tamworthensis]|uniref:sulfotransferase family protein n=1 Tax=Amaricoccus tamworthensis TaxID=57002 RepID=UPI003C7A4B80